MKKDDQKDDVPQGSQQSQGSHGGGNTEGEDELLQKIKDLKEKEDGSVHDTYQQQLQELEDAKKEAEEKALRALAELKNAQVRMENEKAQFAAFATQKLILQALEVYENYHRLMQHRPEGLPESEWLKGLELIDQQFSRFMEQQGVQQLETKVGEKIDPEKHEAMLTDEGEKDVILEVLSDGYELNGRVIKTAKVKVGKG